MANLTALKSDDGKILLGEVKKNGKYFQPNVLKIFEKQKGSKNCGVQSCSLLLNAAYMGKENITKDDISAEDLPFEERKMFSYQETLNVKSQEGIQQTGGLTLEEVYNILMSHGHPVDLHHTPDSSVEDFRDKVKSALSSSDSQTGVIVNYYMAALGQGMFFGHHSPLAAYHEDKDLVLLMDTWYKTEESWVDVASLFNAMDTVDDASGKKRGFIIFRNK